MEKLSVRSVRSEFVSDMPKHKKLPSRTAQKRHIGINIVIMLLVLVGVALA